MRVEHGGVALVRLVEDGGRGGAGHVLRHLEADRLHAAPHDLGGDGVDALGVGDAGPAPREPHEIDVRHVAGPPEIGAGPGWGLDTAKLTLTSVMLDQPSDGSQPVGASSNPANSKPGETVQPTSVHAPRERAACQAPGGTIVCGRCPDARSAPSS